MRVFDCPACHNKLQAADDHAGKTTVCPRCKENAVVPMDDDAITAGLPSFPAVVYPEQAIPSHPSQAGSRAREDEDDDDRPRRRRRRESSESSDAATVAAAGAGIGVIALIIVLMGCFCLGIFGLLAALLVPAVSKVREAAARTQSTNNLKNIGLVFHSFNDVNRKLPFNGSNLAVNNVPYSAAAAAGKANTGSWGFQILPFIDQVATFQQANRNAPVLAYMCPGRGRPAIETGGGAWTDYFLNGYINDPKQAANPGAADVKRNLAGFTDGTSNTVLVGHGNIDTTQYSSAANVTLSTNIFLGGTTGTMRAGDNGEANPGGVTLRRDSAAPPGIGSWGGPFPQGGLMVMGDASVRFFPYSMNNFNAFLTPTGAENAIPPD